MINVTKIKTFAPRKVTLKGKKPTPVLEDLFADHASDKDSIQNVTMAANARPHRTTRPTAETASHAAGALLRGRDGRTEKRDGQTEKREGRTGKDAERRGPEPQDGDAPRAGGEAESLGHAPGREAGRPGRETLGGLFTVVITDRTPDLFGFCTNVLLLLQAGPAASVTPVTTELRGRAEKPVVHAAPCARR